MEEKKEMVNHPSHYCQGDMECIEGLIGAFGRKEVATFCKINAMKYIWRLGHKDDEAQEIGKIKWYLDKYLELAEERDLEEACKKIVEDPSSWVIDEERSWIVINKSELKQKGLTEREAEKIINK